MQKIFGLIFFITLNCFALVDQSATQETVDLYSSLKSASGNYVFYGECIPYGLRKSLDTYQITGRFPAVFMSDYDSTADGSFKFQLNKHDMIKHYLNGGIIMMSWHIANPVTGGTCRDLSGDVVHSILEGGEYRSQYLKKLDAFARDVKKIGIPIIFRPYHENDIGTFWWGKDTCTVEQFIKLWRDLVVYLRDVKGVHNLIYCYSPEILTGEYKGERFPGSDYVDIYAIDNYSNSDDISAVITRYGKASDAALADGKVFGVSEGLRNLNDYPRDDFWTWYFNQIRADSKASKASFVCNWGSGVWGAKDGRSDEADFLEMSRNPRIKFLQYKKGIILSGFSTGEQVRK